jgi:TPR repeat protein
MISPEDQRLLARATRQPNEIRRAHAGDPRAAAFVVWALLRRRRTPRKVAVARHYATIALAGDDSQAADDVANAFLYSDGASGTENPAPSGPDPRWAIRTLRKLAQAGNVHSMHSMYLAHRRGAGVVRDLAAAERWARRAAESGECEPLNNLGVAFREGDGVRRNIRRAVRCYRTAAAAGYPTALRNLSLCYRDGEGVRRDERESTKLLAKAIRLSSSDPTPPCGWWADLGWRLVHGHGTRMDRAAGLRWIRRAAQAGNERSQGMLAELGVEAWVQKRAGKTRKRKP